MAEYIDDEFEWDIEKSSDTRRRHSIDFFFAARLFEGEYVMLFDTAHSTHECRYKCIGPISGALFVVIYTDRGSRKRIISARPASKRDIDDYSKEAGV